MKKMETPTFDFIDCNKTRNDTIIVYNIIIYYKICFFILPYVF